MFRVKFHEGALDGEKPPHQQHLLPWTHVPLPHLAFSQLRAPATWLVMVLLDTSVTQLSTLLWQKEKWKDFCWVSELNQQAEETEDQGKGLKPRSSEQEGGKEQKISCFSALLSG